MTNTANIVKGAIAGVVILGCIAWVAYISFSGGPVVLQSATTSTVTTWMQGYNAKQSELYQQLEKVSVRPTDDGNGIVITGTVKTAADMAKVKDVIEAIEPKTPITWDVKVSK